MLQKFFLAMTISLCVQAIWHEEELIAIKNTKSGQFQTDFRIKRMGKLQSMEGTFVFVADYNDDFDCEGNIYYSALGNNQYKLTPYRLARDRCCIVFDTGFWAELHSELEYVSDLDIDRSRPMCYSYKKGNYTLREFFFNKKALPPQLEPGTYKIDLLFFKRNCTKYDSNFAFYLKLY